MSTSTPNIGLTKPSGSEDADIADLNDNFDSIDGFYGLDKPMANIMLAGSGDFTFPSNNYWKVFTWQDGNTGPSMRFVTLSAPARVRITKDGVYRVSFFTRIQHPGGVVYSYAALLKINSNDDPDNGTLAAAVYVQGTNQSGSSNLSVAASRLVSLNANDYLQLFIQGTTGAQVSLGAKQSDLSLEWVSAQ